MAHFEQLLDYLPNYTQFTETIGSSSDLYPLVFALLRNKRTETYRSLLTFIKNLCEPNSILLNHLVIETDCELAEIYAFKEIFPNSHKKSHLPKHQQCRNLHINRRRRPFFAGIRDIRKWGSDHSLWQGDLDYTTRVCTLYMDGSFSIASPQFKYIPKYLLYLYIVLRLMKI